MQALILVGGIGSRLGSLVKDVPKPCLDVSGRPFVYFLLDQLASAGITKVVMLAGYQAEAVKKLFPTGHLYDDSLVIEIVVETKALGTGGALRNVEGLLDDNFLLLNGDSYFNFDLKGFLVDGQQQPATCFMALRRVADGGRYGEVVLTDGHVKQFIEKRSGTHNVLINTGFYWCRKNLLQWIPKGISSLEKDVFPQLVKQNELSAAEYQGDFIDIGIPTDYHRATVFMEQTGISGKSTPN